MGALIDTSVFIAAERKSFPWAQALDEINPEVVAIASITASELLHGVHRAQTTKQRNLREAFVERILAVVPVLSFDLVSARIHARLWAQLRAQGKTVGSHDLMIAAVALANDLSVITQDKRSFPRIDELKVHVLSA
jgi:predicted nucleic acid-binding protein